MVAIPAPPPDNSGGYFILRYANGQDTHRMRVHVRAMNADASFVAPASAGAATCPVEFTNFANKIKTAWSAAWSLTLDSIWKNNGDGTFTELFGWTGPAPVVGTAAVATPNDQERAVQSTLTMHDGNGGRLKIIKLGFTGEHTSDVPFFAGGNPAGTDTEILVDYLSTASKTNIVTRNGHIAQSPAKIVYCVNRRLRRHYAYN